MRFLLKVTIPTEHGNHIVKTGKLAPTIESILSELKPECTYFTEAGGKRTGFIVVNLNDASEIPTVGEPFFLAFQDDVEFHPVMVAEDSAKAGRAIEGAVKKYA